MSDKLKQSLGDNVVSLRDGGRVRAQSDGYEPLETGDVIADRYEVLDELGDGGMATVFRCSDLVLQRDVAVKVMHRHLSVQEAVVTRFLREAQSMAAIDSPHVVPVYDVGRDVDHVFLVMKLLAGETLGDRIDRGAIPEQEAVRLMGDVLSALERIHERGLVHRDVKAQNIVVTDEGRAILLDLGIAYDQAGTGLTTEGMVLGSPDYMAPEQALGKTIDARTDIYAAGITLFEALTTHVPFSGEGAMEVCMRHVTEKPPSPRRFVSSLSESVAAVVLQAIEKKPDARFQSAAEMRTWLERALDGKFPGDIVSLTSMDIPQTPEPVPAPDPGPAPEPGPTPEPTPPDPSPGETVMVDPLDDLLAEHSRSPAKYALGVGALCLAIVLAVVMFKAGKKQATAPDAASNVALSAPATQPATDEAETAPTQPAQPTAQAAVVSKDAAPSEPEPRKRARKKRTEPKSKRARRAKPKVERVKPKPPVVSKSGASVSKIRAALRSTPRRASLYESLGDALLRAGNRNGAIGAYRRYLSLSSAASGKKRVRNKLRRINGL